MVDAHVRTAITSSSSTASTTDDNAHLVNQGIHEVVDPLFDSGARQGRRRGVDAGLGSDHGTGARWSRSSPVRTTTSTASSLRTTAWQAGSSLHSRPSSSPGRCRTTGQDASLEGLQHVLLGYAGREHLQGHPHCRPRRPRKIAAAILSGQTPEGLFNGSTNNGQVDVPTVFLDGGADHDRQHPDADRQRLDHEGRSSARSAMACRHGEHLQVGVRLTDPRETSGSGGSAAAPASRGTPLLEMPRHLEALRRRPGADGRRLRALRRRGRRARRRQRRRQVDADQGDRRDAPAGRGARSSSRARRSRSTRRADATRLGIETVYQDLALCDNLDVVANMFLGRETIGQVPGPDLLRPLRELRDGAPGARRARGPQRDDDRRAFVPASPRSPAGSASRSRSRVR